MNDERSRIANNNVLEYVFVIVFGNAKKIIKALPVILQDTRSAAAPDRKIRSDKNF